VLVRAIFFWIRTITPRRLRPKKNNSYTVIAGNQVDWSKNAKYMDHMTRRSSKIGLARRVSLRRTVDTDHTIALALNRYYPLFARQLRPDINPWGEQHEAIQSDIS
jgi:hypothetical protein